MKREIAIGDIHGRFDMLVELWNKLQFNPENDLIIFLGDYIDRGPQSKEVVFFVSQLLKEYPDKIILLKGNHEDMAFKALSVIGEERWEWVWLDPRNGGNRTVQSFGSEDSARETLKDFIPFLLPFHETPNAIYVHASIPFAFSDISYADEQSLLWDREYSWIGDGSGRPVICGHTPVKEPEQRGIFRLIDTGAVFGNKLTAYDVLNDRYYSVNNG